MGILLHDSKVQLYLDKLQRFNPTPLIPYAKWCQNGIVTRDPVAVISPYKKQIKLQIGKREFTYENIDEVYNALTGLKCKL